MASELEKAICAEVRRLNGYPFKLVRADAPGWPDQTIFLPHGKVCLIEVKDTGDRLRRRQKDHIELLQNLGHHVTVMDDLEQLHSFIQRAKR